MDEPDVIISAGIRFSYLNRGPFNVKKILQIIGLCNYTYEVF